MDIELKTALSGIREGIKAFEPRLEAIEKSGSEMQRQLDAIDTGRATRLGGGVEQKSLLDHLKESDQFLRLCSDKRGRAVISLTGVDASLLERKTIISSGPGGNVGASVSGVLPIGRLDGITAEARQQLTLRDLLTATPTTFQVVDFVKVNQPMGNASPVAEASQKPENATTFTTVSERVKTIATWIPACRQILDDMNGLAAFISNSLAFYVSSAEELQLLSGDNVGEDLHGLIPQASAFSIGLLHATAGWNKIDIIGRAIQQITAAKELPPTFVVMHPNDWWDLRLTKDGFGRYLLGDVQQGSLAGAGFGVINPSQNLFGLTVDPTTNIAEGTFLIGSGSPVACEIMDRMEMQIDISTEHSTFFTQNLVAVRAEKRLALITRRPGSFVTGTFTTSP